MCVCMCVCVSVFVTYFLSTLIFPDLFPSYSIAVLFATLVSLLIRPASSATPAIRRLVLDAYTHLSVYLIRHPALSPLHGASIAIAAPSNRSGIFWICASLSQGPQSIRLLDLNISSDILALTKLHNSEYS